MRMGQALRRDKEGASAVEFAVVLPVLIMLVFGIIEFGILFAQDLGLSNGARQGARFGVVPGGTCDLIQQQVRQGAATLGVDPSDVDMTVHVGPDRSTAESNPAECDSASMPSANKPCEGSLPDDNLYLTATYDQASLSIPLVLTRSVTLTREGVFRCEYL